MRRCSSSGRDAGHAQDPVEAPPLPPLDQRRRGASAAPRTTSARLPIAVRNSRARSIARWNTIRRRDAGSRPDERARAVVEQKSDKRARRWRRPAAAPPSRSRERTSRRGARRNPHFSKIDVGLPDAGVGRERDAAEGLQDPEAVTPAQLVPERVRDDGGDDRDEQNARPERFALDGQGAGDDERRHRREWAGPAARRGR